MKVKFREHGSTDSKVIFVSFEDWDGNIASQDVVEIGSNKVDPNFIQELKELVQALEYHNELINNQE